MQAARSSGHMDLGSTAGTPCGMHRYKYEFSVVSRSYDKSKEDDAGRYKAD